ncbi:MAG: transposase zinc-binding domain-containing protein [Candidatus Wallbacteria bacterium]|nr:transposase zinc-binding domain-containing protein [Candidatus Wallbacteria bacterium]
MECPVSQAPARPRSPALTLGEIVRSHGHELAGALTPEQGSALAAIAACRPAVLGGHVAKCEQCGEQVHFYNSCRTRSR